MAGAQSIRRPYAELEDATEELVTITVSYDSTTAHHCVKRKLLCETSTWFRDALKDEAISYVRIHEGAVIYECIKHYIHWLNTGTIASIDPSVSFWPNFAADKEYRLLGAIWYFGGKYSIPGLQNAAVSAMFASVESSKVVNELVLPGKSCINRAYHRGPNLDGPRKPLDKLQEALVEMYATQNSSTHFEQIEDEVSPFFLADLCKRQHALLKAPRPNLQRLAEDTACDFHLHGAEEACDAGGPIARTQRRY
ncbi:hypothetical protein HII31_10900 [Pseudocercospora fuligena]|uniref:BTB domain-containing protein n=1 Tax=Pseudocercospora fuligena TaxID=685502 RepID=A0A8H6R9X6_9PEZI|nr:hypothetical protein HII31_10900 [Pseudocercospora fuligena]